ncbi:hypothetical protein AWZ03_014508 [Drosophila navojoa]|uniref:Uncharacterized protein n=1 Tax=Drosophila navojoa TaxID=7232 RepID=A0A484AT84_DRONA|nr:hypothetical protein AWZ03_014508 [Drosophila navojoa]
MSMEKGKGARQQQQEQQEEGQQQQQLLTPQLDSGLDSLLVSGPQNKAQLKHQLVSEPSCQQHNNNPQQEY